MAVGVKVEVGIPGMPDGKMADPACCERKVKKPAGPIALRAAVMFAGAYSVFGNVSMVDALAPMSTSMQSKAGSTISHKVLFHCLPLSRSSLRRRSTAHCE